MKEKVGKWIEKAWKWIKENAIMVIVYWIVIFLIIPILFALLNKEEFNSEGLGLFGDFFGGFIGTILTFASVIILAMTFKQQKKVTEKNLKQQDIQRFNDMFYELLRLYREQVESLSLERYEVKKIGKGEEKVVYKGKDFFEKSKKEMQEELKKQIVELRDGIINGNNKIIKKLYKRYSSKEDYDQFKNSEKCKQIIDYYLSKFPNIDEYNNRVTDELYISFYVKNRDKIAPYFRTLYRILDLIHTSPLLGGSEDDKQAYAKILRAQLTESELFFLKYNAQFNMYGEKLIKYINHYNILKHLPVFELLDFQIFRNNKNNSKDEERVNEIFYKVCKALREGQDGYLDFDSEKYKIKIEGKEGDKEITICCAINRNNVKLKQDDEYFRAFERIINKKGLLLLFEYFMEEIFKDSNFREYNEGAEIRVELLRCNNTTYVISTIKSDKPIQIKYNHEKEEKVN
jgi:uncharacterized membrane protein